MFPRYDGKTSLNNDSESPRKVIYDAHDRVQADEGGSMRSTSMLISWQAFEFLIGMREEGEEFYKAYNT